MTIALTGLTSAVTYKLTGWHNDSYSFNAEFAAGVGYAVTPSITAGTQVCVVDAAAEYAYDKDVAG
jgi:hypothetical protein